MSARTSRLLTAGTALLAAGLLLSGCGEPAAEDASHKKSGIRAQSGQSGLSAPRPQNEPAPQPREIPGLGPKTRAQIPGSARQAIVVTGDGRDEGTGSAQRYQREGDDWVPVGAAWPAHNAVKGWTDRHVQGDLRSPVGVFGLTDAGGHERDPGTELPYDTGPAFVARGTNVEGQPLGDAFDYVVAINYNRKPGTTPLDWTRPLGMGRGGGIWFHVDHGAPTQGCVTLPKPRMRELLRWLDAESDPVVVMGDAASLAR
ncbi:L,D-transpeptidase family protein [Streptomyces sp. N35]|uniref:L,D-transpeptidase family protein n=1 Tax=Streptomyces sp. N35 TaxID=2795730 RepID=UPI0018F33C02|nr:L,D-transpeptidase family protein [Streptomyces sp. N35]